MLSLPGPLPPGYTWLASPGDHSPERPRDPGAGRQRQHEAAAETETGMAEDQIMISNKVQYCIKC